MVKANKGAPGLDGVTVEQFGANAEEEIERLSKELTKWVYKPRPVKRVEIPKPGSSEKRPLGIPCVRDRVVQQSLKISLEKLFEPEFSASSFGFRPDGGQQKAIIQAREIVNRGKEWVVDIDLEKFFDLINHDKVIQQLRSKVNDKGVLKLVGMTLRSGIFINGETIINERGSVQGSPLSPLISNIILDELDKELEKRGLEFCRFADDCNIFVGSEKAGKRVMESISGFIEGRLKLKINVNKSKVALAKSVKFLGITIISGMVVISSVSMKRAMSKVREMIPRGSHFNLSQQIGKVNQWYAGWSSYYSIAEVPSQLAVIEAHIRRRFRSQLIGNFKRKKYLVRKLIKMGVTPQTAKSVYRGGRWRTSIKRAVHQAWSNKWFERQGLKVVSNQNLAHWNPLDLWIKPK